MGSIYLGNDSLLFLNPGARFGSQLATAPLSAVLNIVIVTLAGNGGNVSQLSLVLRYAVNKLSKRNPNKYDSPPCGAR